MRPSSALWLQIIDYAKVKTYVFKSCLNLSFNVYQESLLSAEVKSNLTFLKFLGDRSPLIQKASSFLTGWWGAQGQVKQLTDEEEAFWMRGERSLRNLYKSSSRQL